LSGKKEESLFDWRKEESLFDWQKRKENNERRLSLTGKKRKKTKVTSLFASQLREAPLTMLLVLYRFTPE